MKKIFKFLLVSIIFVINLVGCSNIDEEYNNNSFSNKSMIILDEFDMFSRIHSQGLDSAYNRLLNVKESTISIEQSDSIFAESISSMFIINKDLLESIDKKYDFPKDFSNPELLILCEEYFERIAFDIKQRDSIFYSKEELLERISKITEMQSFQELDVRSQKQMLMSFSILVDSYFYWQNNMSKWQVLLDRLTIEGYPIYKGVGADAQFYGNTHNYAVAKADAKGAVSAVVDHGISSVLSWAVGGVLGFSANVVTGALHSSYSEVVKKH